MFNFMEKLNLGVYEITWISFLKGLLIGIALMLLSGCGIQYKVATTNCCSDGIYDDVILEVPDTTKIDTISSIFQLKRKLRNDFNFRLDFAQYAMNQPLSWYYNNPSLDGIWRPYNRFDVWFHSHQFWTDWAYNYPWFGWSHPWWVKNHRYYNWYYPHPQGWYGWNHYSYDWYTQPLISSNNNYAFINGRRGSRKFVVNSNIEQDTNRRRNNRVYPNPNNNNINNVIRWTRDNNIQLNINSNPPDGTRVIIPRVNNNNIRVIPDTNVRPSRPSYNSRPPVYNNSRGSNNVIRSNNNSSNSSSRGSRGNIKN